MTRWHRWLSAQRVTLGRVEHLHLEAATHAASAASLPDPADHPWSSSLLPHWQQQEEGGLGGGLVVILGGLQGLGGRVEAEGHTCRGERGRVANVCTLY